MAKSRADEGRDQNEESAPGPTRILRASRAAARDAERGVSSPQFRLLRLCRILLNVLGPEPSADRVELRNLMGELQAELGNHRARANATDVAWESDEEQELP